MKRVQEAPGNLWFVLPDLPVPERVSRQMISSILSNVNRQRKDNEKKQSCKIGQAIPSPVCCRESKYSGIIARKKKGGRVVWEPYVVPIHAMPNNRI